LILPKIKKPNKIKFHEIALDNSHQQRGFKLEKFLNELFCFFDLDPKFSFKIKGEQIDGSFTFDNTDYLYKPFQLSIKQVLEQLL